MHVKEQRLFVPHYDPYCQYCAVKNQVS
uniref:Uncharacterized protein n=1 Tax=Anguilla anguilla TaxID=7936 RepID=A0A0E9V3H4_ANGAN